MPFAPSAGRQRLHQQPRGGRQDVVRHPKRFTLDVSKDRLENAPGFDKDNWPDMSDQAWARDIHTYYGTTTAEALTI